MGIPVALINKIDYTKMVKDNDDNFIMMSTIVDRKKNNLDYDNYMDNLKGSLSTLLTINTIIKEFDDIPSEYLNIFYELSIGKEKTNSKNDLFYNIYRYKTLLKLKKLIVKDKVKEKSNNNVLIKK